MSAADELVRWVERKPLILIRFDDDESERLWECRRWPEWFTFVRPHALFESCQVPTICLVEMREAGTTACYLATARRKTAVATTGSRMTVTRVRPLSVHSFKALAKLIMNKRSSSMLQSQLSRAPSVLGLSPKLSASIVRALASDESNREAMEVAAGELPGLRRIKDVVWAQRDAIGMAMAAFGLESTAMATDVTVRKGASSELSRAGTYLLEDNIIGMDASVIPGFSLIEKDATGRAVFQRGDERLEVYTANRGPLEKMVGVDLIYINSTLGSIVMVQYKMLEREKGVGKNGDWVFRLNKQAKSEVDRMRIPTTTLAADDYRLNPNPFYLKFVKRRLEDESPPSFLVSLEHLNQLLMTSATRGPKEGIRVSYNSLHGAYLRESDLIGLIRSGYIGMHRVESDSLGTIIAEVARGNRALVLAWQERVQQESKKHE